MTRSSISSSDIPQTRASTRASTPASTRANWRRFLAVLASVAGGGVLGVWLFVVLVDPFGSVPISLPFDRGPVDGNARYAFPLLARDPHFDSVVLGTSTSRLFRPALLNPIFGAHFANLAMNSATSYEQSRLLALFLEHHPSPRVVMVGLDVEWCVAPPEFHRFTDRAFPEWLYTGSRWAGYREMADLYSIEKAAQAFAEWTGLKPRVYGRDGYTRFVPDESRYDPVRVAQLMREAAPYEPPGDLGRDPAAWSLPAIDLLGHALRALPAETRKLLVFIPPNHRMIPPADSRAGAFLAECKRRVAALAGDLPNAAAIDFMVASPITDADANYWDAWHTRVGIADRIIADIGAALGGAASADYRVLQQDFPQQLGDAERHRDTGDIEASKPK